MYATDTGAPKLRQTLIDMKNEISNNISVMGELNIPLS